MPDFVEKGSIVRRIWSNPDLILLVFAGSAAEFALNRAVGRVAFFHRQNSRRSARQIFLDRRLRPKNRFRDRAGSGGNHRAHQPDSRGRRASGRAKANAYPGLD